MGDENGDEPDPDNPAEYWYCRHCGNSGYSDPPPTNCPNCGKPN
jgi:rubrerythrin